MSFEELAMSKLNEIILLQRQQIKHSQCKYVSTPNSARSFFNSDKCPNLPISLQSELIKISKDLKMRSLKLNLVRKCS